MAESTKTKYIKQFCNMMFFLERITSLHILLLFVCFSLYQMHKWVKKRRRQLGFFKRLGIPYVEPHLIYGSFHTLQGNKGANRVDMVSHWLKIYGNVFGVYNGPKPTIVIADLDMVKDILIKEFSNFVNRPTLAIKAKPVTDTIVGLTDQKWKDVRSLLAPMFSASKLKVMAGVMNEKVDKMLRIIGENAVLEKPVEFYAVYQGLTLDVISECALAMKTNCQRDQNNDPLLSSVRKFLKNAVNPAISLAVYFPFLASILAFISNNLALSGRATHMIISNLKKVIAYRRANSHMRNIDILQLMLDAAEEGGTSSKNTSSVQTSSRQRARRTLTDDEIIANSWVVLLGGFETTASALTYTSYLLARHPHVQEQLYQEISKELENGRSHVSYDDVSKLQYLDQVLNESLRLYPPVVSFISREAINDILIKDTLIPKGTGVSIPVWDIHHNPEYWPEPYTFNPDRFSSSSKISENRHPMSFIPFGEGPRKCIGMRLAQMETKLALARIISTYRLEVCDETPDPLKYEIPTVSLNPSQPVMIRVVKRNSSC